MENWDDIKYFLAVTRAGNVASAAARLGVNHSTVSRRIAALEKRLGVRLFNRLATGLAPTETADNLLGLAEAVEREVHQFTRSASAKDSRLSGRLAITATSVIVQYVLMPMARDFKAAFPDIELKIEASNKVANLVNREADIAIRVTSAPLDTLIGHKLVRNENALYCSPAYLADQGVSEENALERNDLKWIGQHDGNTEQNLHETYFPEGKEACRVDSKMTAIAAALSDLGVIVLPRLIGDAETGLARLPGARLKSDRDVWILYHRDHRHNAKVRAFVDHVRRRFA